MNQNNTIIIYNSVPYFKEKFIEKGIKVFQLYKQQPFVLKIFRKISFKLGIFKSIWFDDWIGIINKVDSVIVFSTNPIESVNEIYKKNPNLRIIFWYWNPILNKGIKPEQISDNICEKWSFDENDCKKHNLRKNTSFYFDNIKLSENAIKYDVIFVGVDKGRREELEHLENKFIDFGLNPMFHIVDDNWNDRNYVGNSKPISYKDYLELLSQSNAILDFVQDGQSGLTLRPFESIFLRKKLITNDSEMIKQDFYNPNNIFIVGIDSIDNLKEFISNPFIPIDKEIMEKYDVINWLNRFFK